MEIKHIEASVLELLNEALALDPSAMKELINASHRTPSLVAHRQADIITKIDASGFNVVSPLSLTNAYLKKLGSKHVIVPLFDQWSNKLHAFVLQEAVSLITAEPAPASASIVVPIEVTADIKVNFKPTSAMDHPPVHPPVHPIDPGVEQAEIAWVEPKLKSSNVKRFKHDHMKSELWVEFNTNRVYVYSDVSPSLYDDFVAAPSQGQFLNKTIKPEREVREVKE